MPETAVVTLLFCDLVGSTELLHALGDDANDDVRRALLAALAFEAEAHRGVVVKSAGDGMMVAFRTSAADAVSCAIAMQRAAVRIERNGAALGLELRVGISSGEASHEGSDWFGTPVVEAARLESAARPGQILVSEVVRTLVGTRGSTQFRDAGKRDFKGFARPVPVVEVVWRDAATPRPIKRKRSPGGKRRLQLAGVAAAVVIGVAAAAIATVAARDSGETQRLTDTDVPLVSEGYTPVLESRTCFEDWNVGPDVTCEDLVVPENRALPEGRRVRIHVTTYPARVPNPGVVTVTIGGFADALEESEVREYGDVVSFDIRGGILSQPSLACPEVATAQRRLIGIPAGDDADEVLLMATEQCGTRLTAEGVDLNQYGTGDMADDIRDLAIAKGWKRINLQANGDWTRIAIELTQRHPGLTRAVVLAEPLPLFPAENERSPHVDAAFKSYLAACRGDEACAAAFPDLESAFTRTYTAYQANPVTIDTPDPEGGADIPVYLDGGVLMSLLGNALADHGARPAIAATLSSGGESTARVAAAYLVERAPLDPANVWGLWNSIYCEDIAPLVSVASLEAQAAAYPLFRAFSEVPKVCAIWPTEPDSVLWGETKVSVVPALLLTGAMNPFFPAAFAEDAAQAFADPILGVFPNLTNEVLEHGPPCISELRNEFLRDPQAGLDIEGCAATVPALEFIGT